MATGEPRLGPPEAVALSALRCNSWKLQYLALEATDQRRNVAKPDQGAPGRGPTAGAGRDAPQSSPSLGIGPAWRSNASRAAGDRYQPSGTKVDSVV